MKICKIKNLHKSFGDLKAVDGVSLQIEKGEIHGILGPNGAGKSTLINCVLGLLTYESGEIRFENEAEIREWRRNIGYVPQDLAIYPELTAEENIRFFCSLYGINGTELKQKTEWALDFVGLSDVRKKKSSTFSGGMKRRLNLACGIVHSPKLVIMDEPTVGIDPQSRNRILENVKALNQTGVTILYTTHYMPEVEEICSKVTIVDHGKVIASGTKQDIMTQIGSDTSLIIEFKESSDLTQFEEKVSELRNVNKVTSSENICRIQHPKDALLMGKVIALSQECGLTICNIANEEVSLEDIFLTLTGKDLRDTK